MKVLYLIIAVLKFLGIAILLLLLLLLFLVIIIMTVPVKYSIYIDKSEDIYASTNFKWLYSIVSLDIIYDSDNEITNIFKLFGRKINRHKLQKLLSKFAKKADDTDIEKIQEVKKVEEIEEISKAQETKVNKDKTNNTKSMISQINSFAYKKELVVDTLELVRSILKNIRPSSIYAEVEIGKDDPADTGQLLAIISALYPLYYSFANIAGNYEKECFYVKIEASGKISVRKFVYDFIKYIRIKSVKELMKFTKGKRKGK